MNAKNLSAIPMLGLSLSLGLGLWLLFLPLQPALSAAAFKCVTPDGSIEYLDLPKEGYSCTQLRTIPAPTPVAAEAPVSEQPEAADDSDNTDSENPKQKNCELARANLATLQSDKEVVVSDKDGNKSLLNAEQRQAALAQAQKDVSYWCD